jgi:hypothetical protein
VFACYRVLHVAQRRQCRRARVCAMQTSDGVGVAGSDGFEPAPGFAAEIVEGTHETPSFRLPGVRSVRPEEG